MRVTRGGRAAGLLMSAWVSAGAGVEAAAVFPTPVPTVPPVNVPRLPCIQQTPRRTYLKASNTEADDHFGRGPHAVALSADGQTLAIGVEEEDSNATGVGGDQTDNSAPKSGAVYVFVRSGQSWVQQAYVKASNTETFDSFGHAVTLSADGNTMVVGAPLEDSEATGVGGDQWADLRNWTDSGAAYVFVRQGQVWVQQAYLKSWAVERYTTAAFGSAVAISADGNRVAVGMPNVGAVFLFGRSGSTWTTKTHITHPSPTLSNIRFGASVALNAQGDTLAVGAPEEDGASTGINGDETDLSLQNAGAVYVYQRVQLVVFTFWTKQAYIKPAHLDAGDQFGSIVALSENGNVLAVGAPEEDGSAAGVNGDAADDSAGDSGAAYLFTRSASWAQDVYVKAGNPGAGDRFGHALALRADGNVLAVGAPREDSSCRCTNDAPIDEASANSGAVYIFARPTGALTQRDYSKAPYSDAGDIFGHGLAISADGNTLAIGAAGEDSNATGINGNLGNNAAAWSGAAFVYSW